MPRAYLVGAAAAAVLGACSSTTSSPDGVASVDNLAAAIAKVFCENQLRCCSALEISALGGRYATVDDCVASWATQSAREQLAVATPSIDAGRLAIIWQRLDACIGAYRQRACSPPQRGVPSWLVSPSIADFVASCPGLLEGRVAAGGRCALPEECATGSHCVSSVDGGSDPRVTGPKQPTGVCLAFQAAGQPCVSSAECDSEAGLVCGYDTGRCQPPAGVNEPCDGVFGPSDQCDIAARLACDIPTRTCKRIPGEGDPCTLAIQVSCDPDPALGLSCVGFTSSATGTCMRAGGMGDACGASALPFCGEGLYCRATQADGIGVCDVLVGEGLPCNGDICARGLVCALRTGACSKPGEKSQGASCAADGDCVSLQCDDSFGAPACLIPSGTLACSGGSGGFLRPAPPPVDGGLVVVDGGVGVDAAGEGDAP